MIKRARHLLLLLLISSSLLQTEYLPAAERGTQEIMVQLSKTKKSVYQLLNIVSEQTGYMFT